jgi:hypothetical protein
MATYIQAGTKFIVKSNASETISLLTGDFAGESSVNASVRFIHYDVGVLSVTLAYAVSGIQIATLSGRGKFNLNHFGGISSANETGIVVSGIVTPGTATVFIEARVTKV